MKVLVAEDNGLLLRQLCDLLEKEGFTTLPSAGGAEALRIWREKKPDFICLDIMMDGMSGYDVCREIRKMDASTPVIFITSKSSTQDKIAGLGMGADDYIVKPFDITEVIARMRAVARRCIAKANSSDTDSGFRLGDLAVFPDQLHAERDGVVIELSLRDVKILRLFRDNAGKVLDRDALLDHCWGRHIMPESRTVDWHISQLRKKIEKNPSAPEIIQTVHGAGYKYEDAT